MKWYFYIIRKNNLSYAGVTPYPDERILKHNGIKSGGAKYTTSKGTGWEYVCLIYGFEKIDALRFEWAVKHCKPKSQKGITNRIKKLYTVLLREKWTSKSPEADTIPLVITWYQDLYKKEINLPYYIFQEFNKNIT